MGNGGEFYPARAFYKKEGRIKYISHLDMNRCVSRALKRSRLPVWHTLGFNPHIYVTFALPLSLGYESNCESFDFRLTEQMDWEEVRDRLNAVLPEGITVTGVSPPAVKPDRIAWADYEITQEFDGQDTKTVCSALGAFLAQPEILVMKHTKKGEKEVDVKPYFQILDLKAEGDAVQLRLRAAAGSGFNLNPTLLLDAFQKSTALPAAWTRVFRCAILQDSGHPFI